jgi:hypothetical protein
LDRRIVDGVLNGAYIWLEAGIIDPSGEGPWIADAAPGPSQAENAHRPIR